MNRNKYLIAVRVAVSAAEKWATGLNTITCTHPEVRCCPLVFMLEVQRVHIEGVHDVRGIFKPRNAARM